jgi:amino acid adenylation domain-containing protein
MTADPDTPPSPRLTTRVAALAAARPDALALTELDERGQPVAALTRGALQQAALALARRLAARFAPGDRVLLVQPPGLAFVVTFLATQQAGLVAVPLPPPRRAAPGAGTGLAAVAADCGAVAVLGVAGDDDAAVPGLPFVDCALDAPESGAGVGGPLVAAPAPAGDALALLQYTSGSTGQPRGVCVTAQGLAAQLVLLAERFAMDEALVGVCWLPHFHDMGLIGGLLLPLWAGGQVALLAPASVLQRPALWWETVSRLRANATGGPDFAYALTLQRMTPQAMDALDLSALRVVFNGAEPVRPQTLHDFAAFAARAGFPPAAWAPVYGLAEATLYVAGVCHPDGPPVLHLDADTLAQGRARPVPPGAARSRALPRYPLPPAGIECVIADPSSGVPCADGVVGEILLRGPTLAAGHWRDGRVDTTEFDTVVPGRGGGFLRTGDLGFLHEGLLQVTGRRKDVIIVAGRNLYPQDLERVADQAHPDCREGGAAAFAVDEDGRDRIVLVQEVERTALRGFSAERAAEVAGAIRARIARDAGVGVDVVVFQKPMTLPRTTSGKVRRAECRRRWQAGELPALVVHQAGGADAPVEPPRSPTEAAVAAAWREVFGHAVGPHDDFFALGGSSLAATQIEVRLRALHGGALPPLIVYEQPTVAAQAAWLDARAATGPDRPDAAPADDDDAPNDDDDALLTFEQQRMWFMQQLAPHSAAYHLAAALRVHGPLDAERLARDIDALVARHAALHRVIDSVDGVPRPRLVEPPRGVLRRVALPDEGALPAALTAAVAAPYDLARDLPLRPTLFALAPDTHVLLVVCHHVAADLWALALLLRDLQQPATDGPDGDRLNRIARAQRRRVRQRRAPLLAYWTAQLHGLQPLALPMDGPRPATPRHGGDLCEAPLDEPLMAGVRRLAWRHQATEYIVMLAALMALLHRLTGQDDIAVGAPVAHRLDPDTERTVGSFVNTVVLRAPVHGAMRFGDLLDRVRTVALDAYAHQDLPFDALVEALRPARDPAAPPLVQVLFNGMNAPLPPLTLQGLPATPQPVRRRASQFDLALTVDFVFHRSLVAEYDDALFAPATVRAMLSAYRSLLAAAVHDPGCAVDDLPLFPPGTAPAPLAAADGPPLGPADGVVARFAQQAARQPGRTAVRWNDTQVDYATLAARVDALARGVRAHLAPGQPRRVAVALSRTPDLPAALLGVLKAGAAYLPVDPDFPAARVRQMLALGQPALVLTESAIAARLGLDGPTTWCLDTAPPDGAPHAAPPDAPPDPQDLAYVIFTSGSTGVPKGVPIRHLSLANTLQAFARQLPAGPDDVTCALTTVSFDIAALELFLPLVTGGTLALLDRDTATSPRRLAQALRQHGVTLAQATPATWQMLLDDGWAGEPGLTALCGGDTLPEALRDRLQPCVAALWNLYGPTETTIWSTAARLPPGGGAVTIGAPIDHTTLWLLDRHGRPVPDGAVGELHIGGLGLSPGYLDRDDLTRERFIDLPGAGRLYRTGDLARRAGDGGLRLLGRADFQIKLRGFRIEPGEIEAALTALPGVAQAVVVTEGDGADRRLVACVVGPPDGPPPAPGTLLQALAARLPRHLVPARIAVMAALPLTPNGKIDRAALPPPAPVPTDMPEAAATASPAPAEAAADDVATALQREVALLWRAVLGGGRAGLHDDFFAAGGHSLRAVQLIERINRRFGLALPLVTLFEAPTIARLAGRVQAALRDHRQASDELPAVVRIQPAGRQPVFFCAAGFGGNTLHLHELAMHLGPDQPFLGLQPHGLMRTDATAPDSVEALAADYRRQIRAVQPHGPYTLGGFSGGGIDAFEVARQLQAEGETVALLVLMDSSVPALVRRGWPSALWRMLLAAADGGWPWLRERLAGRLNGLRWPLARWLAGRGGDAAVGQAAVADAWIAHERVGQAWFALARRYRPGPYRGRVLLLQTRDSEIRYGPANGWDAVMQSPIDVRRMPGSHGGFVREPHSGVAAAALAEALRAARQAVDDPPRQAP